MGKGKGIERESKSSNLAVPVPLQVLCLQMARNRWHVQSKCQLQPSLPFHLVALTWLWYCEHSRKEVKVRVCPVQKMYFPFNLASECTPTAFGAQPKKWQHIPTWRKSWLFWVCLEYVISNLAILKGLFKGIKIYRSRLLNWVDWKGWKEIKWLNPFSTNNFKYSIRFPYRKKVALDCVRFLPYMLILKPNLNRGCDSTVSICNHAHSCQSH